MTLRKLTLSIGLLAASLTLAAPAQAETWSCTITHGDTFFGKVVVFTRKGDHFVRQQGSLEPYKYKIHVESEHTIQLVEKISRRLPGMSVTVLYPRKKRFEAAVFAGIEPRSNPPTPGIYLAGTCLIH